MPGWKLIEILSPTEFRLLPGANDVWDIPEVYYIFGYGVKVTVAQPTEAGRNDLTTRSYRDRRKEKCLKNHSGAKIALG